MLENISARGIELTDKERKKYTKLIKRLKYYKGNNTSFKPVLPLHRFIWYRHWQTNAQTNAQTHLPSFEEWWINCCSKKQADFFYILDLMLNVQISNQKCNIQCLSISESIQFICRHIIDRSVINTYMNQQRIVTILTIQPTYWKLTEQGNKLFIFFAFEGAYVLYWTKFEIPC